jgi:hypothetical protein
MAITKPESMIICADVSDLKQTLSFIYTTSLSGFLTGRMNILLP